MFLNGFFVVFLLMIIITKVSPSYIAEQDYYKHYDDYDDYEYEDATVDKTNKPTDETIFTSDAIPKKEAKTRDTKTRKRIKELLKDFKADNAVPSTDSDDDLTYILTEKPDSELPSLPTAGYEVTEIVDDIPNPVTFKPIVTNFTIKLPLNNATGINKGNSIENNVNKKGNIPRKNTISIFHVNAEFDDDKDNKPVIHNINIHKTPFSVFKVKDHVDKVKDDVLNFIHSTPMYDEPHEGHYLPNILAAPRNFLQKLKEKGSAFYHKYF